MSTTKRLGALAFAAAVVFGACSSTGATTAPTTAPTTATTAPSSGGSAAPSTATAPMPPSASVTLQGAGATFPAPLYQVWFETYTGKYPNIQFNYQANGSGAGIKAITEQTVDFGASDAAMKDEEIAALPSGKTILHVPTALGAVVVIFNLPGVDKLQLDSANVADIFLGTITKWNDPKIAANNAGVTLPDNADPRRPPLRRLGHDERLHDLPRHRQPGLAHQGRQGQGGQVADRPSAPRATTAWPAASSRPTARSATSSSTTRRRRRSPRPS